MEVDLLLWIHARSSPLLDRACLLSDRLGDLPASALLVALGALFWAARRDGREALLWLALGASTFVLQLVLKEIVDRPRPELWTSAIAPNSPAFPSGHALAAATFYPLLARGVTRLRPAVARLAWALAVALATFVGFGRLYLGVHWPSDVLAGFALAALQVALAARLAAGPRGALGV